MGARLPPATRHAIGLVIALRPWQVSLMDAIPALAAAPPPAAAPSGAGGRGDRRPAKNGRESRS
jgi:hypothetical protein